MQDQHVMTILQHLQEIKDAAKDQANELKRIADALERLVQAKA